MARLWLLLAVLLTPPVSASSVPADLVACDIRATQDTGTEDTDGGEEEEEPDCDE